MSKQPHVWVVEVRNPLGINAACLSRQVALSSAKNLREWGYPDARVAKYVRVKPKKGRKT